MCMLIPEVENSYQDLFPSHPLQTPSGTTCSIQNEKPWGTLGIQRFSGRPLLTPCIHRRALTLCASSGSSGS